MSLDTVEAVSRAGWLLAVFAWAGCKVGPDYSTPSVALPDAWLDLKDLAAADHTEDARWWTRFDDSVLNALVAQALAENLSLRQAGLRVIQARAARGISVGEFFPQQQAVTGEAGANHLSENTAAGLGDRSFQNYSVGLDAAWELDFWGRFRRGIESADAALEASVADYDAVLVLLAADVASAYVEIRSLEEQLDFTRTNVKAQADTLELTEVRFKAGAVSELDVATARATLANTQSFVPELEDALRRATVSLCVLLGRPPEDLANELEGARPVPTAPAEIALGVPADLLRRRPDVRRAERVAAALSAQIGVAKADLYPSISIRGSTGFQASTFKSAINSPSAGDLFDSDSFAGFVGLAVNWPILNYGRVENNIRVADARFEEAVVEYRNTVLRAAADVETGLSSFLKNRERAALLAESVEAAERTVELSLIQYRQGAADFLRVNQAQVDLASRQNSLVSARAGIAQGAIDTYRALGGGWETHAGNEFVPRETVREMRERTDWGDLLSPDYGQESDFFLFARPNAGVRSVEQSRQSDEVEEQP
jgi:NodT family efflux transporter outer membrane factor (OMF) lipoprotein